MLLKVISLPGMICSLLGNGLAHSRVWHLVDAKGKILGKLAQRISIALRGKYKPNFHPSEDMGDYVVVINAKDVVLTGRKTIQKDYMWHSGFPGGQKVVKFDEFVEKHPTAPLKKAIWGMMPKNNLRKEQIHRLKLYADGEHPYGSNIIRSYLPDVPTEETLAQVAPQGEPQLASPELSQPTTKLTKKSR
ncbi:hypothetical protein BASA50_003280 [Batrachochytrium salamandrivorans]|uniref:Ribosomal protein L13 n=1 Tax=Batrachochytrium salamandrivorans TaxID=1357716 RepID=A0ABQ8FLX2_9FUNG|nr:hypothetical protein BASA50_003280 [Batrachochytrium salamandrivorans]KAH6602753.1 hypothetical protein BASA61_000784 [Batrachochytrium salamandrivorans]KAH9265963.1 ribosomal protein L13 [Batrachochytrium salamandrivorans]